MFSIESCKWLQRSMGLFDVRSKFWQCFRTSNHPWKSATFWQTWTPPEKKGSDLSSVPSPSGPFFAFKKKLRKLPRKKCPCRDHVTIYLFGDLRLHLCIFVCVFVGIKSVCTFTLILSLVTIVRHFTSAGLIIPRKVAVNQSPSD